MLNTNLDFVRSCR